jgi:hypothetical protein
MVYYRLIYPGHWNAAEGRFVEFAFKNSSKKRGGGISIIEHDCAVRESATVCSHVDEHYQTPMPVLIWQIDSSNLDPHTSEPDDSNGDPCHSNIRGITPAQARKFLKDRLNDFEPKPLLYCPTAAGIPVGCDDRQWENVGGFPRRQFLRPNPK